MGVHAAGGGGPPEKSRGAERGGSGIRAARAVRRRVRACEALPSCSCWNHPQAGGGLIRRRAERVSHALSAGTLRAHRDDGCRRAAAAGAAGDPQPPAMATASPLRLPQTHARPPRREASAEVCGRLRPSPQEGRLLRLQGAATPSAPGSPLNTTELLRPLPSRPRAHSSFLTSTRHIRRRPHPMVRRLRMAKAPPTPAVPALGLHVTPALGAAGPRGPLPAGRP